MKIDLTELKNQPGAAAVFALTQEFPAGWLERDGCFLHSPVTLEAEVRNAGPSFSVGARVTAELKVICDLCLAETVQPISFSFDDEWAPAERAAGAAQEQLDTTLFFAKDEVELDDRLREFFLLHLPMRFVCRPDCRGLCPSCGADLNAGECDCRRETDPRLTALLDFLGESE
ncbi:MAG: DUF177 domain-containing protein [Gracilibacteraceae bacterium]|jgi:uncharacterized protein|nr:DUF177 domain-containing protein [Gracilibacteraceae bacterium]